MVARSAPDGYNLLWATAAVLVTNPHTFKTLPYDPLKDFITVGKVAEGPFVVAAHPDLAHSRITRALLSAVPKADPDARDTAAAPTGEVADPANLPPGCAFSPRCPFVTETCRTGRPELTEVAPGHLSSCFRAAELTL